MSLQTTVIILAAGISKKMSSYGNRSLLKINGKTLLQHQIDSFRSCNKNINIIVVVGHDSDKIIKQHNNVKYIVNQDYRNTCNGHSALLGLESPNKGDFIIINNDLFITHDIAELIINNKNSVLVEDYEENKTGKLVAAHQNNTLLKLGYNLNKNLPKWSQVINISESKVGELKKSMSKKERQKWMLHEHINFIIETKSFLNIVKTDFNIKEVTSYNDYQELISDSTY